VTRTDSHPDHTPELGHPVARRRETIRSRWQPFALGVIGAALLVFPCSGAPRPPWASNRVVGSPNPPAPYTVQRVFPHLTFTNPVDLAFMPGSDRLFVVEQAGRIWSIRTSGSPPTQAPELAFDAKRHRPETDSVFALAFDPGFATNRHVFINYNEQGTRPEGARVSRFSITSEEPPRLDPQSELVILRWLSGGHNGCSLAFGNDGFLYISTGDAANPDPPDMPYKTGQDVSDLLSSILRLDVRKATAAHPYVVPGDNPFIGLAGARPEIWAFGFRNPWRMSFDRRTGDLWAGDVGWEQWEMIYRVRRGGNYGWSLTEGPNPRIRTDVTPGPGPILPPVVALPHSEAASITGGRVYYGKRFPELRGAYVFGDWESGKFWALRAEGDTLRSNLEMCDTTLQPISFAEDAAGELLILNYTGGLYAFARNQAPPANAAFPRALSETGLFADTAALKPAAGVVSYQPAAEMWSDHARVERLVGVPGDGVIVTANGRQTIAGRMWNYPSNTVFARTLSLEGERGKPATQRRIETQMMHYDGQAWNGYTFRWNEAQTDATLVPPGGTNVVFTMLDASAPGGRREIPWRFLGRTECLRCHQCWASDTLSFNWLQLGAPRASRRNPDATDSEFDRLEGLGVVRVESPPGPKERQDLVDPYDGTQSLEARARSWLHVNCAGCHRFNGGGVVAAHLNLDKPLAELRVVNERPTRGDFELRDARIVAAGQPYHSTLLYRIATEGSGHMPHVGSQTADEAGVRLIRDWIASLPTPPDKAAPGSTGAPNRAGPERALSEWRRSATPEAMPGLLAQMNTALAMMADVTEPALRGAVAAAAAKHTNALVRDLFQRWLPPEQRRVTLGPDIDARALLEKTGDARRGKLLFTGVSQCARCHTVEGNGRAYGPDLTGIGRKYTRGQLIEQIVFPSRIVAPEYKSATVILDEDRELTGFVVSRTSAELVLRDETLAEHRLRLGDVKAVRETTLSAMPEGLLAPLTAQEAADLLEYLASTEPPSP
jgi:putative heme-binding domain-containing protein